MKIKPSKLLKLETVVIEDFKTKVNVVAPSVSIENNLSLSYSVLQSTQERSNLAVRMKAKTIKKTHLQFSIEVMFIFSLLEPELSREKKNLIIPTMVSISYSTLRGILLRELPLVDSSNRILPVIDLPTLLKTVEKRKSPQK